eukprot:1158702-Pelagomonas_calceolata.AAC.23
MAYRLTASPATNGSKTFESPPNGSYHLRSVGMRVSVTAGTAGKIRCITKLTPLLSSLSQALMF